MKTKTKKAAAKRFRITKNRKIMRRRQMNGHLKANKSKSAKNRYHTPAQVSKADKRNMERLMPYN